MRRRPGSNRGQERGGGSDSCDLRVTAEQMPMLMMTMNGSVERGSSRAERRGETAEQVTTYTNRTSLADRPIEDEVRANLEPLLDFLGTESLASKCANSEKRSVLATANQFRRITVSFERSPKLIESCLLRNVSTKLYNQAGSAFPAHAQPLSKRRSMSNHKDQKSLFGSLMFRNE
jgi:hypothetical protein